MAIHRHFLWRLTWRNQAAEEPGPADQVHLERAEAGVLHGSPVLMAELIETASERHILMSRNYESPHPIPTTWPRHSRRRVA